MALTPIKYIDRDAVNITIVRCMKCNAVVATRRRRKTGQKLVHMSHSKRLTVQLQDGSEANLIVCADCLPGIKISDLPKLTVTMQWGWEDDLDWKIKRDRNRHRFNARQNYERIFNTPINSQARIPLAVRNKLNENKGIVKILKRVP